MARGTVTAEELSAGVERCAVAVAAPKDLAGRLPTRREAVPCTLPFDGPTAKSVKIQPESKTRHERRRVLFCAGLTRRCRLRDKCRMRTSQLLYETPLARPDPLHRYTGPGQCSLGRSHMSTVPP